jgi:hypothetical protein
MKKHIIGAIAGVIATITLLVGGVALAAVTVVLTGPITAPEITSTGKLIGSELVITTDGITIPSGSVMCFDGAICDAYMGWGGSVLAIPPLMVESVSGTDAILLQTGARLHLGIGNTGAAPTCDATTRGTMWLVNGGTGVTDTVSLCLKAAADTYSWITLTTGG